MTTTDVQPLLDRVADELRTHGWCQGIGQDSLGQHCLMGAADAVIGVRPEFWDVERELARRIGVERYAHVVAWNDAPGRTVEEVFALLAPR